MGGGEEGVQRRGEEGHRREEGYREIEGVGEGKGVGGGLPRHDLCHVHHITLQLAYCPPPNPTPPTPLKH